jgi:hypothetical protein
MTIMKRIHAMLEDENYAILDKYKKKWAFRSIDDALNDLIKNHEDKESG